MCPGLEEGGEPDVEALVGKDGHVVDLGPVLLGTMVGGSVEPGVGQMRADPLPSQLLIPQVGMQDELVGSPLPQIAAQRKIDGAAEGAGMLDGQQVTSPFFVIVQMGRVLSRDRWVPQLSEYVAVGGHDGLPASSPHPAQADVAAVRQGVRIHEHVDDQGPGISLDHDQVVLAGSLVLHLAQIRLLPANSVP